MSWQWQALRQHGGDKGKDGKEVKEREAKEEKGKKAVKMVGGTAAGDGYGYNHGWCECI
jgi:hypothetical protein